MPPIQQNVNLLDEVMRAKKPVSMQGEADTMQAMQTVATQPQVGAQQLGAAMASSKGQEEIKRTQAAIQEATPKVEADLAKQQMQAREEASAKEIAYRGIADKNTQRLFELDRDAAIQITDKNRQFKLDSAGRKYMNSQMLDQYMVEKAVSEEQLKDYTAQTEAAFQRKAQLMQTYYKNIERAITQGYIKEKQELDQKSKEVLVKLGAYYKLEEQKALKKARQTAGKNALIVSAFTVAGAVGGGLLTSGTPMGVAGGAAAGTMLGTAVVGG